MISGSEKVKCQRTKCSGPVPEPIYVEPVRRKVFPGLLVCQNAEAALQTAPDRDSGSDRQRIHRGESVNKFPLSF
jgi:hypothetical protein